MSRNTVRKYLDGDGEPQRQEAGKRPQPVLDAVRERIDELVREWGWRTTPKQRVTGTLVHQRLRAEGYQVGSTTVRAYLAEQRRVRAGTSRGCTNAATKSRSWTATCGRSAIWAGWCGGASTTT